MAEPIRETIAGLMRKLQDKGPAQTREDPRDILRQAFNKRELRHLELGYFDKGVLTVKVDSSSLLYSVSLKKAGILDKLRKKSSVAIKDIRFVLGEGA